MVITLGGSFLYSGLALLVSTLSSTASYESISGFPDDFKFIANYQVGGVIPFQILIYAAMLVVAFILLHKTKYGRKIILTGVNQSAAEYSGIHTRRVIMSTYVLSALAAAIAGIVLTAYLGTAKSDLGGDLTMDIITAVVLGGTLSTGGKGSVIGTALASLAIALLRFGLPLCFKIGTQYLDIPVASCSSRLSSGVLQRPIRESSRGCARCSQGRVVLRQVPSKGQRKGRFVMKNMTRRGFLKVAGAGAAVAGLGLVGCGGGSGSAATTAAASGEAAGGDVAGKTVAFIPKITGNAFFESANDGAQKYAKDWGFTVDYLGSSSASASDQVGIINQAVANGVDALCISTVDAAGVSDALKKATDAGIVVTTWDSDAQPEDRTLMVSQGTPEILGQMLVDMSVDGLKQRGKDPSADKITYAWHYSQATVTDQNSWQVAAEAIIKKDYPNWENVHPDNYYSNQDAEQAKTVGAAVLSAFPDIDLIICNDSTALPGQLAAAEDAGYDAQKITITGFASPQSIKSYCENGTIYNWGLWDCAVQGAMGCYVAAYLAAGNTVKVGDTISIPSIGDVKVEANDSISEGATTGDENNGVVLLPERLVFTKDNMNDYNF